MVSVNALTVLACSLLQEEEGLLPAAYNWGELGTENIICDGQKLISTELWVS